MDIREIIGNNVFKARKIRNLSQEQFAEMINIEPSALSKIENGKSYPSQQTIENIIYALKIKPDVLFKTEEKIDIEKYGPAIENMKCFPNKINVEFVQCLSRNTLKIRTWERGVGETYACGTGSCASFCIAYYKGICSSYVKAILRGGELKLNYNLFGMTNHRG